METLSDIIAYVAGLPAIVGLVLTALTIFLTSDWRLSLTALLVQFLLVGVVLTGAIRIEIALVKMLVGVLSVSILYITARRIQDSALTRERKLENPKLLGMPVGWDSGPLGLPIRLLVVLLVGMVVLRVFDNYTLTLVPAYMAFAAVWLGAMGVAGLILANEPLRVAPALLTILAGFDLVYATLEPSLAVVGFWSTMLLLAALAFAYLAAARGLSRGSVPPPQQLAAGMPVEPVNQTEPRPEPTGTRDGELGS